MISGRDLEPRVLLGGRLRYSDSHLGSSASRVEQSPARQEVGTEKACAAEPRKGDHGASALD